MDLAGIDEEDRLSGLPMDVLSQICKSLTLKETGQDHDHASSVPREMHQAYRRDWFGLRYAHNHHGGDPERGKSRRRPPCKRPLHNKALRSCGRVLRLASNTTQTSISFCSDKQDEMDPCMRSLPNLRAVSISYNFSSRQSSRVHSSLVSLHKSLPSLTAIGLHHTASGTRIEVPLKLSLPLWGSTLQHLELHSIKCVLGGNSDPNSYSLGFLAKLPVLRVLVLYESSPFPKTEDLGKCTSLQKLVLRGFSRDTPISLDLSSLTSLVELDCEFYSIRQLNVSGLTLLRRLECGRNSLDVLELSTCTALRELSCFDNSITVLDLSKNLEMRALDCTSNPLPGIYVDQCVCLQALRCGASAWSLTNLDFSGCSCLHTLECEDMWVSALDLQATTQLQNLSLVRLRSLLALNLAGLAKLESIYLDDCRNLSTIDVTGCTALHTFNSDGCDM